MLNKLLRLMLLLIASALMPGAILVAQTNKKPADSATHLFKYSRSLVGYSSALPQSTPVQSFSYPNAYFNKLGIMCKAELKMEKATRLPIRVRVGSLQYTNWMEQKPNSVK